MLVDDPDMPLGERAKLLDFGIAKLRSSTPATEEAIRRTDVGIVLGTPVYMSPEQFLEEELDGQSDVYSLGAMIYEMVARQPPFAGRKWGELALKHLHEAPVPLRQIPVEVPEALDVLVMEMLAKDLHERPVMAQVVDRLDELAEFLRTGSRPAVAETEMFVKLEPEEVSAPLEEVEGPASRPALPSLLDRMPPHLATPAHPARFSVAKAPTGNEAKTIRWVTLALGLVTGAFLLCVYLLADRHPVTPAPTGGRDDDDLDDDASLHAYEAADFGRRQNRPGPPIQGKSPHPRRAVAPRFARRQ